MGSEHLAKTAETYLQRLCSDIPHRRVGSDGNRVATDFFARTAASFGLAVERSEFDCLDCILACPVEVIDADYEREKAVVVNQVECISCLNCEEVCPTEAVRVDGAVRRNWQAPPIEWDMWGPAEMKAKKT